MVALPGRDYRHRSLLGGTHPATTVRIVIPWSFGSSIGPAQVRFTAAGGASTDYTCRYKSRNFRDVAMEIDVCASVNMAPLLPSYDTHWHNTRPADTPQRMLTIESSYEEAGIGVTSARRKRDRR